MSYVRIFFKLLGISVLILLNLYCCPTDRSCLYPGHQNNELVSFSITSTNNIYPVQTTATYRCENAQKNDVIKAAVCHTNGTWTFTTFNNVNCSLATSIRCKRPVIPGISLSLHSLIFEGHCFSLYKGISKSTWSTLKLACDIGIFMPQSSFFDMLKESMCDASLFKSESEEVPRKIFLAMRTENNETPITVNELLAAAAGTRISVQTPPKCSYLDCSSDKSYDAVVIEDCRHIQTYWICKHNISSCGNPSQEMYSTMDTTGKYINSTATYNCQSGYKTTNFLTRRCGKDGLWSGQPPNCKRTMMTEPNVWLDPSAESNENALKSFGLKPEEKDLLGRIIGSVAGVTLFLIAFMWLVLAVLLWRDKRKEVR